MAGRSLPGTCCADERSTVWLGPGGRAAYLGGTFRLGAHSGSVACFALGVDAPFLLRTGDADDRIVRSAFVPARTRHQIVAETGRMLFLHLDPRSPQAALLQGRMTARTSAVTSGHRDESWLVRSVQQEAEVVDPAGLVGAGAPPRVDPRIRDAMAMMRAQPARQVSAAHLAAQVNLSPSRFLHLFSADAGTSFRRYRLWARMMHVARAVSRGSDLTTAAADAGYASASHFSDTFRAMFGLTMTSLLARPTRFVVADEPGPGTPDPPVTSGRARPG